MTDLNEIALLRLAAQRLVGDREPDATATVRWMTAVQAQQLPDALDGVTIRTAPSSSGSGVRQAIDDGRVVRSWPMRGTLHLVLAEDLGWMLSLTTEGLLRGATRRREQLGLTAEVVDRAEQVAREGLAGGGLRRADLMALWEEAGLLGRAGRGYHLLWNLSQRGVSVFGPFDGAEQRIVLVDEWVPHGRGLAREEALGEWATRYLRSHGPASRADLAAWTKLPLRDVDVGLDRARAHLETLHHDGTILFLDPETPERLARARAEAESMLLIPAFDELILGYRDRTPSLAPEHLGRVVPGGNGVFRPVVVDCGRAVGTWRRSPGGGPVAVESFSQDHPVDEARLRVAQRSLPPRT